MAQACPPDRAVAVGDIVDVKNYGRAEVIEPLVTDPSSRFCGRVRVRYQQDGKTYYVRPEALRKAIQVRANAVAGGCGNTGYAAGTSCRMHQRCKHTWTRQGVAWCVVGCMVNVRDQAWSNTTTPFASSAQVLVS